MSCRLIFPRSWARRESFNLPPASSPFSPSALLNLFTDAGNTSAHLRRVSRVDGVSLLNAEFLRYRASMTERLVTAVRRCPGWRRIHARPSNYLRATASPLTLPASSTHRPSTTNLHPITTHHHSPAHPTPRRALTLSPRLRIFLPGRTLRPAGARLQSSRPLGCPTSSSGQRCSWW